MKRLRIILPIFLILILLGFSCSIHISVSEENYLNEKFSQLEVKMQKYIDEKIDKIMAEK